ncbi:MAG: hypothetical protein KDA16_06225 [Phycisphaerales bacterium]|nr:hypothetical protein [Phycisphaerales bacterium]
MNSRAVFALTTLFAGPAALGAWNSDPAVNISIADGASDQAQPKIAPGADCGSWVSWFDGIATGYDVRVQLLDADGNEVLAHNGVLVADRNFSSTQDYGLSSDPSGNAFLAYRFNNGAEIRAAKVLPDGSMPWGVNGVIANTGGSPNSPRCGGTSDGGVVVGWSDGANTVLQRFDANGVAQWGTGVTVSAAGFQLLVSDIRDAGNGDVIVSWIQQTGFLGAKHLWAQKFDSAGAEVWASRVAVYDGGSLQFGNFPRFWTDGAGGGVFAWYDSSGTNFVQHVSSAGAEMFAHNGVATETGAGTRRYEITAAYDQATSDIYAFYRETDASQGMIGLSAQRFDATGARQWTDNGLSLVAMSSSDIGSLNAAFTDNSAKIIYTQAVSPTTDVLRAFALDATGASAWVAAPLGVSTVPADMFRTGVIGAADGEVRAIWQHNDDVHGQNITRNANFGVCPGDATDNHMVDVDDLNLVLSSWGNTVPPGSIGDLVCDGVIDVDDLNQVLSNWGSSCP